MAANPAPTTAVCATILPGLQWTIDRQTDRLLPEMPHQAIHETPKRREGNRQQAILKQLGELPLNQLTIEREGVVIGPCNSSG